MYLNSNNHPDGLCSSWIFYGSEKGDVIKIQKELIIFFPTILSTLKSNGVSTDTGHLKVIKFWVLGGIHKQELLLFCSIIRAWLQLNPVHKHCFTLPVTKPKYQN